MVISEYKANIPGEIGQSLNKIHSFTLLKLIFNYQEIYPSTNLLGTYHLKAILNVSFSFPLSINAPIKSTDFCFMGAQVQSLAEELGPHMLHSVAIKIKTKRKSFPETKKLENCCSV